MASSEGATPLLARGDAPAAAPAPAPAPRRRRRRAAMSLVAVLVLLGFIAVAGYVYAGRGRADGGGAGAGGELRGRRRELLEQALARLGDPADAATREAADFLVRYMPDADAEALSAEYIATNVELAMRARSSYADRWTADLPWIVFLNDVLPYASLAEPRDSWREVFAVFMDEIASTCQDATCVTLRLNEEAWAIVDPPIVFQAAPPDQVNSYSPFQTMRRHNSSCTGLAIFLVDALRSVGIPARVAGVPHWNKGPELCPHGDADAQCGNHNWVEVFIDGAWHFVDQRGNSRALDKGWFFPGDTGLQRLDHGNHSIYSTSWAPAHRVSARDTTGAYRVFDPAPHFPMAWDWSNDSVPAWESVRFYHHKSLPRD